MHGVIFNSANPEADRLGNLGEPASQALGFYKTRQVNRTIDYEKVHHGGETFRLEWNSDDMAWLAMEYHNDTNFEKVWNYSTTKQTERCVNQNNSVLWQFLSNKNYEILTQCWNPSVFWRSNMTMDKAFQQDFNHFNKSVQECKKDEFS